MSNINLLRKNLGAICTEYTMLDEVAILNTNAHVSDAVSIEAEEKFLIVYNTLDKLVAIQIEWNDILHGDIKTVPAGELGVFTPNDLKALYIPEGAFTVQAKCAEAPTTGSVTVWLQALSTVRSD